jgi:hypothetical protein
VRAQALANDAHDHPIPSILAEQLQELRTVSKTYELAQGTTVPVDVCQVSGHHLRPRRCGQRVRKARVRWRDGWGTVAGRACCAKKAMGLEKPSPK